MVKKRAVFATDSCFRRCICVIEQHLIVLVLNAHQVTWLFGNHSVMNNIISDNGGGGIQVRLRVLNVMTAASIVYACHT